MFHLGLNEKRREGKKERVKFENDANKRMDMITKTQEEKEHGRQDTKHVRGCLYTLTNDNP